MEAASRQRQAPRTPGLKRWWLYAIFASLVFVPAIVFYVAGYDARGISLKGSGGPLVAFSAGALSFVSPCVLPLVPIYVTNLAGASFDAEGRLDASRGRMMSHAVAFLVGLSVVFITLGASVGLIGFQLVDRQETLETVAGIMLVFLGVLVVPELGSRSLLRSAVLLVAMTVVFVFVVELAGLQDDRSRMLLMLAALTAAWAKFAGYLPAMSFFQRTFQLDPGSKRSVSYSRSALIGGAFATGWTPCIGPILGGILTLAATTGDAWTGAYLLGFYSLGFSIPFLLTALAVEDVSRGLRRLRPYMGYIEVASALMLIGIGMLLLSGKLTALNNYFTFAEFNEGL